MQTYYFSIKASYDECLKLYQPGNNAVVIIDEQGTKIQIPIKNLRPFVSPTGIRGRFRLQVSGANKLVSFEKMS
ncbi:MAG: DUF2835 domain-containing protein [Paraglaciecola sp.]|nr:DUF2835 domain-containing protein [Paraglaciecola sp.]